jgi:dihydropteroate synthase
VNVTPLALHSARAVRDVLRGHGWDEPLVGTAAGSLHTLAFHLTGLDQDELQALVPFAGTLGLEVLTGDSWAILAGSRSRLSALARPWTVPEPLAGVAVGIGQAMPGEPVMTWQTARGPLSLDRPVLVGILNVTPDSFSDGGRFAAAEAALAHTEVLLREGATIIDVGGESTRPGRTSEVPAEEECRRVLPVIEALAREHPELVISADTVKASVAKPAVEAGAAVINDVSGFRLDPAMASVVAQAGAGAVLMHSRGSILEVASYTHAEYGGDVVGRVIEELGQSLERAAAAGVAQDAVVLDPGFGFSKTVEQNMVLLDQLAALASLDRPVLVGPSRKRFLGSATGLLPEERDRVTGVACALAWERGARLFRVHNVAAAREALDLALVVGAAAW